MYTLLLFCRPGFESELAAEISDKIKTQGWGGYPKAKNNSGLVTFHFFQEEDFWSSTKILHLDQFIFARQILWSSGQVADLPENDRWSPLWKNITEAFTENVATFHNLYIETPDSDEYKQNLSFCRSFGQYVSRELKKKKLLNGEVIINFTSKVKKNEMPSLHLVFLDKSTCYPALSFPERSSPLFMGIPRLKMPKDAPSRATLKLEEAIHTFLSPQDQEIFFNAHKRAADLGAAPGGWTYQLVKRNMIVYAVDNAEIDPRLMESGHVYHEKKDAFTWIPPKRVELLVCDIVEKPSQVTDLICKWFSQNYCQAAIFNLKLPMKKRKVELEKCIKRINKAVNPQLLRCKQLYFDREEVTLYVKK